MLVIIGSLFGGILMGQELITSARIRNLIAQQDASKAAFFGFQDRFRAFPGDYAQATSNIAGVSTTSGCGLSAGNGNGNGNGQIEAATNEMVLAWEHLSKAGFISGTYTCAAVESNQTTPVNPYGVFVRIIYDGNYGISRGGPARHNIKTGAEVPVAIIAEVDRKIDDGAPYTGGFQFSAFNGNAPVTPAEGDRFPPSCTSSLTSAALWNATNGSTNCGGASLL